MRPRIVIAVVTAWVLGAPKVIHAQLSSQLSGAGTSVTFTMPVNLTQLSSDLERVRLLCGITSEVMIVPSYMSSQDAMPKDEVYVLGGQLVTTMKVMVPIPLEWFQNRPRSASPPCTSAGSKGSASRLRAGTCFPKPRACPHSCSSPRQRSSKGRSPGDTVRVWAASGTPSCDVAVALSLPFAQ